MIIVTKIEKIEKHNLFLRFSNQELRKLNLSALNLSMHNPEFIKNLFDIKTFKKVKIGKLGQIYWTDLAYLIDEKGKKVQCEFDFSPEFVYNHSIKISE